MRRQGSSRPGTPRQRRAPLPRRPHALPTSHLAPYFVEYVIRSSSISSAPRPPLAAAYGSTRPSTPHAARRQPGRDHVLGQPGDRRSRWSPSTRTPTTSRRWSAAALHASSSTWPSTAAPARLGVQALHPGDRHPPGHVADQRLHLRTQGDRAGRRLELAREHLLGRLRRQDHADRRHGQSDNTVYADLSTMVGPATSPPRPPNGNHEPVGDTVDRAGRPGLPA